MNPVSTLLSLLGLVAAATLPFLRVAPNRLVSGEPVRFASLLHGPSWGVVTLGLALLMCAAMRPNRLWLGLQWVLATTSIAALVAMAGHQATVIALTASSLARTSLGAAFWFLLILLGLVASDALQRLQVALWLRSCAMLLVALPVLVMLALGWCDELSIMKEYANNDDKFMQAIWRHVQIVGVAMVPTLLLGVPLGWLASRAARVRKFLFPILNIVQTVPSIALFGLLMAPLALLAALFPTLAQMGISGVGLAPGVIALTLYSLLPVVRGTLAGLEQVPSGALQAAAGMGMGRGQIFRQIEVPLAMPVLLVGVRTALIQAIGLAAVTSLIGAGGLGDIMFGGLNSSAQDLVLLGVVPIVLLAVLADAAFQVIIKLSKGAQP